MNKLHYADEEYYLTSEYLLKLAQNASKLFESSEVYKKGLLLKMTLQRTYSLMVKKAQYDWLNPSGHIANLDSSQAWLLIWDAIRTIVLKSKIPLHSPLLEFIYKQNLLDNKAVKPSGLFSFSF